MSLPTIVPASIALGFACTALLLLKIWTRQSWTFSSQLRAIHIIQPCVQGSVYWYLSLNSPWIGRVAPLILYQIAFAFVVDLLIALHKHKSFRFGFSVLPIVLSVNLFLWFRPEYFYLQLIMIVVGVWSKHWIVDENQRHIFNPSGIALFAATLFGLFFGLHYFLLREIVDAYHASRPNSYYFILMVGTISQFVGGVTLISLGAISTLFFLYTSSQWLTAMPLMNKWIDPAVLVGVTLLVTDPATSPKGKWPQFAFGALYGCGIAISYGLLTFALLPGYFAKILALPLLNYFVPTISRWRPPMRPQTLIPGILNRLGQALLYALVFLFLVPTAERRKPSLFGFWSDPGWARQSGR